jgi:glycine cleavage system protein P-like pyridoxal-binding family
MYNLLEPNSLKAALAPSATFPVPDKLFESPTKFKTDKNLDKLINDYDKIDQEVISNLKNELLNNPNINSETDIINSETDIINKIQALDNIQLNAKLEELSRLLESAL